MNRKGLDGQIYNNLGDLEQANANYLSSQIDVQNEEQLYLLKKQQLDQEIMLTNHVKEQQRILNENEKNRQTHEEKMRTLRLFDDIGINKDLFEKFMDYLFPQTILHTKDNGFFANPILKSEKAYKDILEIADKINLTLDDQTQLELSQFEIKRAEERLIDEKMIRKNLKKNKADYICFKSYVDSMKTNGDVHEAMETLRTDELKLMIDIYNHQKIFKHFSLILTVISIILFAIFSKSFLVFLIIPGAIYFSIKFKKTKLEKIENQIEEFYAYVRKELILAEEKMKNLKTYEEYQKDLNILVSSSLDFSNHFLEKRSKEFEKFRLNHYNTKIEKLLLDLNIPEKLEERNIEFISITSKESKSKGEIDDYIEYFQEKIKK